MSTRPFTQQELAEICPEFTKQIMLDGQFLLIVESMLNAAPKEVDSYIVAARSILELMTEVPVDDAILSKEIDYAVRFLDEPRYDSARYLSIATESSAA